MPAKLSLAAFDRTTSMGILALQHLINKLEGLPQLRAVDQHEACLLYTSVKYFHKYLRVHISELLNLRVTFLS